MPPGWGRWNCFRPTPPRRNCGQTSSANEIPPAVYAGSKSTFVTGINNAGIMVGIYQDSQSKSHGFVYNPMNAASPWKTIDPPNAISISPTGVNDARQVVGSYDIYSDQYGEFIDGFLYNDVTGKFQSISTGLDQTFLSAINGATQINGQVSGLESGNSYTFIIQNGKRIPLDPPIFGAITNNAHLVYWTDSTWESWVYDYGLHKAIDVGGYPGANATFPSGASDGGSAGALQFVGYWAGTSGDSGFIATSK